MGMMLFKTEIEMENENSAKIHSIMNANLLLFRELMCVCVYRFVADKYL